MAQRRPEISILNVSFCVFVMGLHLLSEPVSNLARDSWQFAAAFIPWKLACMAVYGFVFLSGLKLFLPTEKPFRLGSFYLRRLKTIVGPYVLAVCVYALYRRFVNQTVLDGQILAQYLFLGRAASHFYFIVVIVQFYALMPLWRRLVEGVPPMAAIPLLLLGSMAFRQVLVTAVERLAPGYTLQYQDRFFMTYLGIWACGCYAGRYYDRFLALVRSSRGFVLVVFGLLAAAVTWLDYLSTAEGVWVQGLGVVNTAYTLSAILASCVVGDLLARRGWGTGRLFSRVDRASYLVYLYHMLVLLAAGEVLTRLGVTDYALRLAVRCVVVPGVTIPACSLWQRRRGKPAAVLQSRHK